MMKEKTLDQWGGGPEGGQAPKKKKKKIGKYILLIILLLIVVGIVAAVLHFLPLWREAKDFEQKLDLSRFSYTMDLELDEAVLTADQREIFNALAEMDGLGQNAFMRMRLEGSVWEDKVYVQVTPSGAGEPALEMYLSSTADLMNAGPIYNKIRKSLVEEYAILDSLLPAPVGDIYMTLEQAEQLSGKDLSGLKEFELPFSQYHLSAVEYFAVLAALPLAKVAENDSLILEEVKKNGNVCLHFETEHPAQIAEETLKAYERFSTPELLEAVETIRGIKKVEIFITSEGVQEVVLPTRLIDPRLPSIVEDIRKLIETLQSLAPELQQAAVDAFVLQQGGAVVPSREQ